mmetsp:Transcript_33642/g.51891  ORF Transcript_33642/g.51891 Transcript_33642/m.51891 type:complete len:121 (+) Transcript_33642:277-639(+)
MGFIAYSHNIENSVRQLTLSKLVNLKEAGDRNRLFVTGQQMMLTEATTSSALCGILQDQEVRRSKIRRASLLDKNNRATIVKKMKDSLQITLDLQNKYIDLPDYKRTACFNIEKVVYKPT